MQLMIADDNIHNDIRFPEPMILPYSQLTGLFPLVKAK